MTYADIIMLENKVKYDNDVDAMLALGRAYAAGDGVARDKNTALAWLRKAALAGKAEALAEIEKLTAGGDNTSAAPAEKTSTASPEEAPAEVVKESQARKTAVWWKKFFSRLFILAALCSVACILLFMARFPEGTETQSIFLGHAIWFGLMSYLSFISCKERSVISNVLIILLCVVRINGQFGNLSDMGSLAGQLMQTLVISADRVLGKTFMLYYKVMAFFTIGVGFGSILASISVLRADYMSGKK